MSFSFEFERKMLIMLKRIPEETKQRARLLMDMYSIDNRSKYEHRRLFLYWEY